MRGVDAQAHGASIIVHGMILFWIPNCADDCHTCHDASDCDHGHPVAMSLLVASVIIGIVTIIVIMSIMAMIVIITMCVII